MLQVILDISVTRCTNLLGHSLLAEFMVLNNQVILYGIAICVVLKGPLSFALSRPCAFRALADFIRSVPSSIFQKN